MEQSSELCIRSSASHKAIRKTLYATEITYYLLIFLAILSILTISYCKSHFHTYFDLCFLLHNLVDYSSSIFMMTSYYCLAFSSLFCGVPASLTACSCKHGGSIIMSICLHRCINGTCNGLASRGRRCFMLPKLALVLWEPLNRSTIR